MPAVTASASSLLVDYAARTSPGLLVFVACLALVPTAIGAVRIAVYIAAFILIRDAMTPTGLWSFQDLRIQFVDDGWALVVLGVLSLAGVVAIWAVERPLRPLLVWRRGGLAAGGAAGLGSGVVIGVGALTVSAFSPAPLGHTLSFTAGLVVLAYGGNLLEELLFRGYLQGWLESHVPATRAALLSGLLFAACHAWLAITVTDVGWAVLAFTAAEGLACAFVRLHYGIWSATLTHGTAILLVAAPMA